MATSTSQMLRNEAQDLLGRAQKALEEKDRESYDRIWLEYVAKNKEAEEEAGREAELKAALEKYAPAPSEIRNPEEALIQVKPTSEATKGVLIQSDKGGVEVVQFADDKAEGWIKGYPSSVQHPSIIRRLTAEKALEASQEFDAFCKYVRYGERFFRDDPDGWKALQRLNLKRIKALQEGDDPEGGYLVPTDAVRLPIIMIEGVPGGVTRPISSQFTTTRDGGTWPASTDALTFAGIAEEAAGTASDPTFTEVPFTIRKAGRNNKVSEELLADSAVNIPSLLGLLFTRALGRYEDQQAIEGDGSTEPLGLRTTGAPQGDIADITDLFTIAGAPTVAELLKAYHELPAQWRQNATWHTTSSFMGQVAGIGSTAAGIHHLQALTAAPDKVLLGRPVVMFDGTGWDDATALAASEEVGCFGDFSQYYFITRVGMMIRRLDERYADTDQVGFRVRVRYDSFFAVSTAFIILKVAAT